MWFQNFYDTFYKCFIKEDRYQLLLDGIGVTVKVSLLAVVFGLLIGFLIALCNLSNKKGIRLIGKVYTDIIRGTPTVTQLMIIYFVIFASVHWPKWVIAAIAFGINSVHMFPRSFGQGFSLWIRDRRKQVVRWA